MLPLLLLASMTRQQPFQFTVTPDHGLTINVAGVPVVQGSWVQFYEPDWSKTYFSSMNGSQTVRPQEDGSVDLMFKSQDGRAYGTEVFTPLTDGVKVFFTFGWTGEKPVTVELAAGLLWADPLMHGTLTVDGKSVRSLMPATYANDAIPTRLYAANGKEFAFDAPAGKLTFSGQNTEWTCFDARNLNKLWARGKDLIWLGRPSLVIPPNQVVTTEAEWHFEQTIASGPHGGSVTLHTEALENALVPHDNPLTVLPTPKEILVKKDQPMEVGTVIGVDPPSLVPDVGSDIAKQVRVRWAVPAVATTNGDAHFFCRIQDLNLPVGGYEIRISPHTAILLGQDVEGLHNAVTTLGQLFFAHDGKLCLPSGIIRDWPSSAWRGVHLFVGPEALDFHQRLWDRVLDPMKFNKVVLQCERTKWHALPDPKPPNYMSRSDLLELFSYYRGIDVEPIPLIESLGHMSWLFNDKAADPLDLFPFPAETIDPRLPASQQLLSSIWDEAIALLHPAEIHFGLDEINLRWPQPNPELTTQLWDAQLPFLAGIAARHNCRFMCWGDQCLAPGDAPDAALADNEQNASDRRAFIPKGAVVTDWHYTDNPLPSAYIHTLELWKQDGATPIAAAWFRPENIEGFYLAAIQEGLGTLQTTWAGYESNEQNMIREFRQFAAMIVAADYAWSGRKDRFDQLGYDPYEVFARMYFDEPSNLTNRQGESANLGGATESQIGEVNFKLFEPYSLRSLLTPATSQLPNDLVVETPGLKGRELCLAVDTTTATDDYKPVADLEVDLADGSKIQKTLLYGVDVRSTVDSKMNVIGPKANGLSLVKVDLGSTQEITKLVFHDSSSYAGLRLHGVTVY